MELKHIRLDDLHPAEYNPRQDLQPGDPEYEKIRASLELSGLVDPIIVRTSDLLIIGGHQRVKVLQAAGITDLHILELGGISWVFSEDELPTPTDTDAKALNIALNKITGAWDLDKLNVAIQDLEIHGVDIEITGFDAEEIEAMFAGAQDEPKKAKEDNFEPPAEIETDIEPGDIYQLGKHRIMCGDATCRDDVDQLLQGQPIPLTVTSPPYPDAKMWETSADDLITIGNGVLDMVYDLTPEGGVLCWNTSDIPRSNEGMAPNTARDTLHAYDLGWKKRGDIVWEKGMSYLPPIPFTRRPTVPNCTHESILVFFKGDWQPRDKSGVLDVEALAWNRESIWKIKTESAKDLQHKAPFPVELPARCITLWSLEGDPVYDPFCGAGTTLIACEQLGRVCYGMEISPQYCEIICSRWEKLTGQSRQQVGGTA